MDKDVPRGDAAICTFEVPMLNVAIVGIDGAGKTSLARALAERSAVHGRSPVVVKSRRKTLGNQVWEALALSKEAENSLAVPVPHAAAFVCAMFLDMTADLRANPVDDASVIVWDRHLVCLAAYGLAMGLPADFVRSLTRLGPRPDLVLWLDAPPSVARDRLLKRRTEQPIESPDYLTALRAGYEVLLAGDPSAVRIDAEQSAEVMLELAWTLVAARQTATER